MSRRDSSSRSARPAEDRSTAEEITPRESKVVLKKDYVIDSYNINKEDSNYDTNANSRRGKAEGSLVIDASNGTSDMNNGQTFELRDSLGNAVTFEIVTSTTSYGVENVRGNATVGVLACSDAADVASRFLIAINNCFKPLHIEAAQDPSNSAKLIFRQLVSGDVTATMNNLSDQFGGLDGTGLIEGWSGGYRPKIQPPFSAKHQIIRSTSSRANNIFIG